MTKAENRPTILVIDDECDHASVNTRVDDPDLDPTAINRCIRNLLASFERSAYVGYTATPFANIFIAPKSSTTENPRASKVIACWCRSAGVQRPPASMPRRSD